MRFVPSELPGVVVVEPDVHRDTRGYFLETYHDDKYRAAGIVGPFVQDNESRSTKGTLRGLPVNRVATVMATAFNQIIVGDVLVVERGEW